MAWSGNFISSLSVPSFSPKYKLNFLGTGPDGFTGYGGLNFATGTGRIQIGNTGIRITGQSVIPSRWNISLGGFSVPIVGDIRNITPFLQRGMLAELLVNIGGGYERVAIGGLKNITGQPPNYRFEFNDLISAFSNIQNLNVSMPGLSELEYLNINKSVLFGNVGCFSYCTTASGSFPSYISVNETSIFLQETSQPSLIYAKTSASDQHFAYIQWNNKSSTSGTGNLFNVSIPGAQIYPEVVASNAVHYPINQYAKVISCAYLSGFPGDILGKLILSTGQGTNGILDTYPVEWSLGGGASYSHDIFDYTDVQHQKEYIKSANASYSYGFNLPILEPWHQGLRNFVTIAAKTGQWPVIRQGSISWRGCSDPDSLIDPVMSISDKDILSLENHEFFSSSSSTGYGLGVNRYVDRDDLTTVPYYQKAILYGDLKVSSFPSSSIIDRDNSQTYKGDYGTSAGRDERYYNAYGDNDRMRVWDFFTHEKLVLRCHLRLAVLCPGDVIELTSNYLYGLLEAEGKTYQQRRCMVTSVSFSFSDRSCVIGLAIPSRKEL